VCSARLGSSVSKLSSGLRVVSAADDAAGMAIRELMRSDIAVLNQGIRNASDAISMIQTAEGAMSVIDEKLIRMKELAEQAATGTYTTAQREIMNSEYQAMAAEIDRIANATDFNGVKLLDGSLAAQHSGFGPEGALRHRQLLCRGLLLCIHRRHAGHRQAPACGWAPTTPKTPGPPPA
jgi:flagellin